MRPLLRRSFAGVLLMTPSLIAIVKSVFVASWFQTDCSTRAGLPGLCFITSRRPKQEKEKKEVKEGEG